MLLLKRLGSVKIEVAELGFGADMVKWAKDCKKK
jgi:hypothetical protein